MLIPVPTVYRRRSRSDKRRAVVPPVVIGPQLVSAVYEEMTSVTLTFDRAVTLVDARPAAVRVFDGNNQFQYRGEFIDLTAPNRVLVRLEYDQDYAGSGVTMSADGESGIVATDDGAVWAGVSDWNLN